LNFEFDVVAAGLQPGAFGYVQQLLPNALQRNILLKTFTPEAYNYPMSGIQFVTDQKGRKVAVLIDLKKHGTLWQDFWDGLVSQSRRKEKSVPYEQYRASRLKRSSPRG
jgi:hypothetical protein